MFWECSIAWEALGKSSSSWQGSSASRAACSRVCAHQLERGEEVATSWVFHPGLWQTSGAVGQSCCQQRLVRDAGRGQ